MAVTSVPLPPIKKGSLGKLWFAVILIILTGGALAWYGTSELDSVFGSNENYLAENGARAGVTTLPSGVQIEVLTPGEGASPRDDDIAIIGYRGSLRDGTVFDENEQAPLSVNGVIPGFSDALKQMKQGGKYRIWIPSDLAYGENSPTPAIPPNSLLIFEVEMIAFQLAADYEAQLKQLQEMIDRGEIAPPPGGGQ